MTSPATLSLDMTADDERERALLVAQIKAIGAVCDAQQDIIINGGTPERAAKLAAAEAALAKLATP